MHTERMNGSIGSETTAAGEANDVMNRKLRQYLTERLSVRI